MLGAILVVVVHYLGTLGGGVTATSSSTPPTFSGAVGAQVGLVALSYRSPTLSSLEMALVWLVGFGLWSISALLLLRPQPER